MLPIRIVPGRPRAGRPVVATGSRAWWLGRGLWRRVGHATIMTDASLSVRSPTVATMSVEQSPAERVSTVVDGVDVLGALSPSRAADFMSCPLLYRFRTIDRLPEPFSPDAVRGTRRPQGARGPLRPARRRPHARAGARAARAVLGGRCSRSRPSWPRCSRRAASPATAPTWPSWLASCRSVLDRYFTLEDPTPARARRARAVRRDPARVPAAAARLRRPASTSRPTGRSGSSTTRPAAPPARCSRPRRCSR